MKYRFSKIANNHNHSRLRDDMILCDSCSKIIVGEAVTLLAPPRERGAILRYISTSAVENIEIISPAITEIITSSGSKYRIEEMG